MRSGSDAAPFKQWYLQHYGVDIGRKKKTAAKKDATDQEGEGEAAAEETKKSNHVLRKIVNSILTLNNNLVLIHIGG
ncbi:Ribosomal protein S8e [Corchorus capsularis]|uniref:Ribosomal protein S8e n=1 Tax=Corchorus capsularis TaxID=210143 RepID=A0A1R3FUQ9_COCAP|nr:Ribosomal protein S8e [Corchorus capsularis]